MGKLKSSSEDPNETTSKVTSRIGNVVWFLIKWGFRFALAFVFGFVGFVLALGGIRVPKFDLPRPNPRKFDPEKFRRELEEMRVEDLLKGFGKQLEEFDTNNKLNSEEKKGVRSG